MPTTDSAVAVDQLAVAVGSGLTGSATASASAISEAATVDGTALSTATVLDAVGVQQSSLSIGGDGVYSVVQTGVADASAVSTNGTGASSAVASATFTANAGGILDGSGSAGDVDIVLGQSGTLAVSVNNTADASAIGVAGGAESTADIAESYGLANTGLTVGRDGALAVSVDADALATSWTVGASGAGTADATSTAEITDVIGIMDLGDGSSIASSDFSFGEEASIIVHAGTKTDQVSVTAAATTSSGDATASSTLGNLAGIRETQSGTTGGTVLSVGDHARITATAYGAVDATAITTEGISSANADTSRIAGIQAETIVVGNGGVVQGQSGLTSDVLASVVDGLSFAATATSLASNDVVAATGLDLEGLTIGDDAISSGSYGIFGRTDVDLTTGAFSSGADSVFDETRADAQVNLATGIQLGIGGTSTALTVGDTSTMAGVADVSAISTAASVDGETDAVALIGDDAAAEAGAIGLDLNGLISLGSNATILGQGLVTVEASASNVGNVGTRSNANASAGAERVAGIDYDASSTGTIGSSATITALGSLTAEASANSVTGAAQAQAGSLGTGGEFDGLTKGATLAVSGLTATDRILAASDAISIGDDAIIDADASAALNATATTVAAAADADARSGYANALAVEEFTIGQNASIDADSVMDGVAMATSTEGATTAEAIVLEVIGALNTAAVRIGRDASLTATADSEQTAVSTSVSGNGTATAESTNVAGLDFNFLGSLVTIGNQGFLRADALSDNTASAISTDGSVVATADSDYVTGFKFPASLTVGESANVTGFANSSINATASTIGDSYADLAKAVAGGREIIGIDFDDRNGVLSIGKDGSVAATSIAEGLASAAGVKADAEADVVFNYIYGLDLAKPTTSPTGIIQTGASGNLTTSSNVSNEATANSIDGNANASIDVDQLTGLGDGRGGVNIGAAGVIDADAVGDNVAIATTIDADSTVTAVRVDIENKSVWAINITSITVAGTLAMDADAISSQRAIASAIGDPGQSDGASRADVADDDNVFGITSTTVTAGSDVSQLTASATLIADATARNMSGDSSSESGDSSDTMALQDFSTVQIGGDAENVAFQAVNKLSAEAVSVEEDSTAMAGDDNDTKLTAVRDSDITVGGSLLSGSSTPGTLIATVSSDLTAIATTNGSQAANNSQSKAEAGIDAEGWVFSALAIGGNGNLLATANVVGTADATNVGNRGDTDSATAILGLNTEGLTQTTGDTIVIGNTGNVTGQASTFGSSSANNVSGSSSSTGDLNAFGIDLRDNTADITIGGVGNISGLAVIGTLAAGSLADAVEITASSVDGPASATSDFDAYGVRGVDGGTLLTAGPRDGDVSGQALAGGLVLASNTGDVNNSDVSKATITTSDLVGLQNVDILGGQTGTNLVRGVALGTFEASAFSVKGDAVGSADTNAYGFFDANTDGSITTSGVVTAIAQLSNTVVANTVHGNASSNAASDSEGFFGYNSTLIGSGAFNASALSNTKGLASSVAGSASS